METQGVQLPLSLFLGGVSHHGFTLGELGDQALEELRPPAAGSASEPCWSPPAPVQDNGSLG